MTIKSTVRPLTAAELQRASEYLKQTRDELIDTVADLSEAQWMFKPSSDRWSVGENVEHLGIVEGMFLNNVAPAFANAPVLETHAPLPDADVIAMGKNRGTKLAAPERLFPSGTMRPQLAAARLLVVRERTREFLEAGPYLRERSLPHPVVGMIDGYQWVLLVAAHTERHRQQILELKSDPQFPLR